MTIDLAALTIGEVMDVQDKAIDAGNADLYDRTVQHLSAVCDDSEFMLDDDDCDDDDEPVDYMAKLACMNDAYSRMCEECED